MLPCVIINNGITIWATPIFYGKVLKICKQLHQFYHNASKFSYFSKSLIFFNGPTLIVSLIYSTCMTIIFQNPCLFNFESLDRIKVGFGFLSEN